MPRSRKRTPNPRAEVPSPARTVRPGRGSSCHRSPMAHSYSKGPSLGKLPACAICAGPGRGPGAALHLPGGVRVWLCAAHRSPEFLSRRAGRDLGASLLHVWRGGRGASDRAARARSTCICPGWPPRFRSGNVPAPLRGPLCAGRREACFASGEAPGAVITRLRGPRGAWAGPAAERRHHAALVPGGPLARAR